jgi:hypothetical protein
VVLGDESFRSFPRFKIFADSFSSLRFDAGCPLDDASAANAVFGNVWQRLGEH